MDNSKRKCKIFYSIYPRIDAVTEIGVKKNANKLTINTLSMDSLIVSFRKYCQKRQTHLTRIIHFLDLLADNGRLGRLQGIAKSFGLIMSAHKGQVHAKVTTAKALNAQELKELQAVLQTFLKKGHSLLLETKVDASVIGGMVVELGDRYIDLSISSKLKTYSNIIKETL